jgi:group I intron endonuclease
LSFSDRPSEHGFYGVVYLAFNRVNEKVYIGITQQILNLRISDHKKRSQAKDHCYYFQNAIKKYGIAAFDWVMLEAGNSEDELNIRETFYIDFYQSYLKKNGYNLTYGGDGCKANPETAAKISASNLGKKRSDESKKKMSVAVLAHYEEYGTSPRPDKEREGISSSLKGHPVSDETRKKLSEAIKGKRKYSRRPVIKLDKSGNILERFSSAEEAAKQIGYSRSSIYDVCYGKSHTCGGWAWKFDDVLADELQIERDAKPKGEKITEEVRKHMSEASKGRVLSPETKEKLSIAGKGRKCTEETKVKMQRSNAKAILQIDKAGNIVAEFFSGMEAERQCGFSSGGISNVCRGKAKTSGGFFWCIKEEYEGPKND